MKNTEEKEIDLLLGNNFTIPIRIFGIKKIFKCKKISMGLMLKLSKIFIKMNLNEKALNSNDMQEQISEQYQSVVKNADKLAQVVALCVSDNIFFQKIIKRAVLNDYTSKDILNFAQKLLKASDYGTFMLSIALMNGNRPTKAVAVEK